jgi:predicted  nucleic acid-binding Zn-ribbon protein
VGHLEKRRRELREELASERTQIEAHTDHLSRLREQLSLRERQMGQLIEWVKALLQWSTKVIHGGEATSIHLEAILPAIDAADAGAVPQIATTGIRLVQQSAEVARLAEQSDLRASELEQLNAELDRLRAALSDAQAKVDDSVQVASQLAAAREALVSMEGQLDLLTRERQAEVERFNHQIQGLWRQISARDRDFARLRDENSRSSAELQRSQLAAEELRQREQDANAELRGQLGISSAAVTELHAHIRRIESELEQLRSSRAWKLLKPLRALSMSRNHTGRQDPPPHALRRAYWFLTFQLSERMQEWRGAQELRETGLFDEAFYVSSYPDVATGLDPAVHYLRHGRSEARNAHPLFDTRFYLEQNPDVTASGMCPLLHFHRFGADEGRNPNPVFDTLFYVANNPFIGESGLNPLVHYAEVGARLARDPSPAFGTKAYLEAHPEVALRGLNPLAHHLHDELQEDVGVAAPPEAPRSDAPSEAQGDDSAEDGAQPAGSIRLISGS